MLEKIFGKKSTGVVYIVCAGLLLLSAAATALSFWNFQRLTLSELLGYEIFALFELFLISAPVFVQKKYKLYIPPLIEIGICLYAVLYLAGNLYNAKTADISVSFLPLLGGFVVSMTVFCLVHSLSARRAEQKGKNVSALYISLITFFVSAAAIVLLHLIVYGISAAFLQNGAAMEDYLAKAYAHEGGNLLFCIIGGISVHSHTGERFKIRSFKDPDEAKRAALENKNRTEYRVIENISADSTDYKKLLRKAKAGFFAGRLVYLALYAAYLVYTCISFWGQGSLGQLITVALSAGFAVTAAVYGYEYYLFKHDSLNQRLRKLKIVKASLRIYSLLLMTGAVFVADSNYDTASMLATTVMFVLNLYSLIYNIFGKPKHYPSAKPAAAEAETGEPDGRTAGDTADPPRPRDTSERESGEEKPTADPDQPREGGNEKPPE